MDRELSIEQTTKLILGSLATVSDLAAEQRFEEARLRLEDLFVPVHQVLNSDAFVFFSDYSGQPSNEMQFVDSCVDIYKSISEIAMTLDGLDRFDEADRFWNFAAQTRSFFETPPWFSSLIRYDQKMLSGFTDAINYRRVRFGENSPLIIPVLSALAVLTFRWDEAIDPYLQQLLRLAREQLPQNRHLIAQTLVDLASIYFQRCDQCQWKFSSYDEMYSAVSAMYREALALIPDEISHLKVDASVGLAECRTAYETRLDETRAALVEAEKFFGTGSTKYLVFVSGQGIHPEDLDERIRLERDYLKTAEPYLGRHRILNGHAGIGAMLNKAHRYEDAISEFAQVFSDNELAQTDLATFKSLYALALEKVGRIREADRLYDEYIEYICNKQLLRHCKIHGNRLEKYAASAEGRGELTLAAKLRSKAQALPISD